MDLYLRRSSLSVCLSLSWQRWTDDGGQPGYAWRGHNMDAGRWARAVALGPGGHEAGLQLELEPRRICGCRGGYVRISANRASCQNCERLQWRETPVNVSTIPNTHTAQKLLPFTNFIKICKIMTMNKCYCFPQKLLLTLSSTWVARRKKPLIQHLASMVVVRNHLL